MRVARSLRPAADPSPMDDNPIITVRKLDHQGRELLRYRGELLELNDSYVKLHASFDHPDKPIDGLTLRKGDQFVEWHYCDRWYNVFAVHDVDSGALKGWYCNVTRPAVYADLTVSADDLALDLLVHLDGSWEVLDRDEFDKLALRSEERRHALQALDELQRRAEQLSDPFFQE